VADGGTLVQDDDWRVGSLELLDHRSRVVACCFHDSDALFDDDTGICRIVRRLKSRKEGQVHTERL